jgi:hypothetical protein
MDHLGVEISVVGGIEVNQIESWFGPIPLQPMHHVLTNHFDLRFVGEAVAHGLQVFAADASGGGVVFHGNNHLCAMLQGFTSHHTAAATEIQPATTVEAGSKDIHYRFANTGRGGPCVMAWGAQ